MFNFDVALNAMFAGKNMRRRGWSKTDHVRIRKSGEKLLLERFPRDQYVPWDPTPEEILAPDWAPSDYYPEEIKPQQPQAIKQA